MWAKRIIYVSAAFFVLLLSSTNVSAQQVVYKWTDEDGVVHFDESPPSGVQAERIVTSPAPSVPALPADSADAPVMETLVPAEVSRTSEVPDAEKSISEMSLAELDARCEAAREELIAPLRQAEVEKCQAEPRTDPASCVRRNADFGAPARMANGSMTPAMFHDIPPCLDAQNERNRRPR